MSSIISNPSALEAVQARWAEEKTKADLLKATLPSTLPSFSGQRVTQLDALTLDDEMNDMLVAQLGRVFALTASTWQRFESELRLSLDALLFYLSVGNRGATYGQMLQNLVLDLSKDPTKRRREVQIFFLFSVVAPYALRKWQQFTQDWVTLPPTDPKKKAIFFAFSLVLSFMQQMAYACPYTSCNILSDGCKVWQYIAKLESAWKLGSFINFLIFLYQGRYPTLIHRLLGLQLVQAVRGARVVSFEFMNRQLIWNGFADFMIFMSQNFPGSGTFMVDALTSSLVKIVGLIVASINGLRGIKSGPEAAGTQLQSAMVFCPICNRKDILIPYGRTKGIQLSNNISSVCNHRFCYSCLQQRLHETGGRCKCPLDSAELTMENTGRLDITQSSLL